MSTFRTKLFKPRGRRSYEKDHPTREAAEAYVRGFPNYLHSIREVSAPYDSEEQRRERQLRNKRERRWNTPEGRKLSNKLTGALERKLHEANLHGVKSAGAAAQQEHGLAVEARICVDWKPAKPKAICQLTAGTVDNTLRGFPMLMVDARVDGPTFELALVKLRIELRTVREKKAKRDAEWAAQYAAKAVRS